MQIDFHHAVTYAVARLAGFTKDEAHTISTASQYVDDAVWDGAVKFDNRAAYIFVPSAHKMLDYKNYKELANHQAWVPFHFLPSNHYEPTYPHAEEFIQRITCRPNSMIAQEMMNLVRKHMDKAHSLHLLGIACHVYIDTWAHQGFVGIMHEYNEVEEIYGVDNLTDHEMMKKVKKFHIKHHCNKKAVSFKSFMEKIKLGFLTSFISEVSPLGHGAVLTYPDLPYLKWSYLNRFGEKIERNNPTDFIAAIEHLYAQLVLFKDPQAKSAMSAHDRNKFIEFINGIQIEDGEERHQIWCQKIGEGAFSFGKEEIFYDQNGSDSWYAEVFNELHPDELEISEVPWSSSFMQSDWKKMHDAILFFRTLVLSEILPKHNLCIV